MGIPVLTDISTTQFLYLRLREHHKRGVRQIVRVRDSENLIEIDSPSNARVSNP